MSQNTQLLRRWPVDKRTMAGKQLPEVYNQDIHDVQDMTTKQAYQYGFKNKELAEKAYNKAMLARLKATQQIVPGRFSYRTNPYAFRPIVHLMPEDAVHYPRRFNTLKEHITKYQPYYMGRNKVRINYRDKGAYQNTGNTTILPDIRKELLRHPYNFKDQYGNIYAYSYHAKLAEQQPGISWQQMPALMPDSLSTVNIYPYKYEDRYYRRYKDAYKNFFTKAGTKAHQIGHPATQSYQDGFPVYRAFPSFSFLPIYRNPRYGYTVNVAQRLNAMHQGKVLYSNYTGKEAPQKLKDYIEFLMTLPRNHKGFIIQDYYGTNNDPASAMQDDLVQTYLYHEKDLNTLYKEPLQRATKDMLNSQASEQQRRQAFQKRKYLLQKRQLMQRNLKRLQYQWQQASLNNNKNKHVMYG